MRDDERLEQLRMPPQSIEAEQAVIGGIMLAPNAYERVADMLRPEFFYRRDHQLIYRSIQELAEKNQPLDAVTLGEWFESMNMGHEIGGGAYLIELASTTPSAANIKAYAQIVRDKAMMRRLIEVGTTIVNNSFNPDGRTSTELVAEAESAVMAVDTEAQLEADTVQSGLEGLKRTVALLAHRREHAGELLGCTTSLDGLDEYTAGLQDDDLIILAARPSMGKSALMAQMRRAAAKYGRRPYTLSMEMGAEALYMRDIAALGRVDFDHVQRPRRATPAEMARMKDAIRTMKQWDWWLDDGVSLTVDKVVARLRRMKKQHNIGVAYIDYLQFFDLGPDIRQGIPHAVQQVTRKLKATAKELHIPIVLLSQLNRSVESRPDKRPNMSDLRESGAIEQDADMVLFLYRQGYYEKDWARDDPRQRVAEIIAAKVRNGQTGTVTTNWYGEHQLFTDLSYDSIPPNYYESKKPGRGFEAKPNHGLVVPK